MEQKCKSCGELKDLSEFVKSTINKSGYTNKCKKCANEYFKNFCKTHPGSRQKYNKNYGLTDAGRKGIKKYSKSEKGQIVMKKSLIKYYSTPKGQINKLNKKLKKAKKEETKIKIMNKIEELKKTINVENK